MGWAGPAQPTGSASAQNCWADFGPKKHYLLGQTRPRRQGWAGPGPEGRTGPGSAWPRPKRAGGINFPPPLHAERYSFCMQRRKKINTRIGGKKSYLARGWRWLAAFLAVLWRRLVAASWLTDGGSKQRRRSVFCVFP